MNVSFNYFFHFLTIILLIALHIISIKNHIAMEQ